MGHAVLSGGNLSRLDEPDPEGGMDKREFLRQLRRLKLQLTAFDRSGRELLESLPDVPDDGVEPVTPEAEIAGTLGCLLMDDLGPALQKIAELEDLLQEKPETTAAKESQS
jgi:hypothetical protein